MAAMLRSTEGLDLIDAARAQGKGVIVATPHLGAWEVVGLEISRRYPMATLYKSQGDERDQLINTGRARFGARLAPSTQGGVRTLLQALRQREVVGILPDQDPPTGSGVFAPFFGVPAHTPVLVSRLARRTGAVVVFVYATRLAGGRGFTLHCLRAPEGIDSADEALAAAAVNRGVEQCVQRCPEQYWWGYKRFRRRPAGEARLYA
jgi:KDO2-lipid IV(A) lauroyltransferase